MTIKAGLAEVAVALPLPTPLHYRVPPELAQQVRRGSWVLVPLGSRRVSGYVIGLPERTEVAESRLRPILELFDPEPILSEELLDLLLLAARYYAQPPGEMIRAALPAGIHTNPIRLVRRQTAPAALAELRERRPQLLYEQLTDAFVPCQELLRRVGQGCRPADLRTLERLGLAELSFEQPRPRVGRRLITEVIFGREPSPDEALGPRQLELLQLVREQGRVARPELAKRWPAAATVVQSLVRKGLLTLEQVELQRDPFLRDPVTPDQPPVHSTGQLRVLEAIRAALHAGGFAPFLLDGETGSGKTEIYLEAIRLARERGRCALVLVPEISLTPQLAGRFRARFGDGAVAVLHSGLSEGERYDQWRQIKRGEVTIVVGARSAIFAPLRDPPAVVVVDEEHDASYHQDEMPRYDARNLALVRGQRAGAVVILGSATPSLESHQHALTGRYRRLELRGRPTGGRLPGVELVDLRRTPLLPGGVPFSPQLCEALRQTLAAREQAILFLNRRGFAPVVLCRGCGEPVGCPQCSVSLTFHRQDARLRCHYCDHEQSVPERCPRCGHAPLLMMGLGTEKVEAILRELFPAARLARLDRDTVSRRGFEATIRAMRERTLDLLVGTQMVAKGHDFPGVTLVGVILADQGLRVPDFRAAERTFQLLAQVAGRAGRGDRPGRVIIQTYCPEHHALRAAQDHDHQTFSRIELAFRRELGFPPFTHLLALHLDGEQAEGTREQALRIGRSLEDRLLRPGAPPITLLGPAPAPLEQLRGRYRWQLLLKAARRDELRSFLPQLRALAEEAEGRGLRVAIDVDPISML